MKDKLYLSVIIILFAALATMTSKYISIVNVNLRDANLKIAELKIKIESTNKELANTITAAEVRTQRERQAAAEIRDMTNKLNRMQWECLRQEYPQDIQDLLKELLGY